MSIEKKFKMGEGKCYTYYEREVANGRGEGKCYTYYEREVANGNSSGAEEPYLLEEPYHPSIRRDRMPKVPREQCENILGKGKRCPEFNECYDRES